MIKFKLFPTFVLLIISGILTSCLCYFLLNYSNKFDVNLLSGKLLIDTDAGADDAGGILLAIKYWQKEQSDFEIIGITCVHGNTNEENVESNVLKTLTIANATHIPVYSGSKKPLTMEYIKGVYFGEDGLGDFDFEETITAKIDRSMLAPVALVHLADKYKGELNIVTLGPLTNIAIAIALDPEFLSKIKRLYVMGGSTEGRGNRSPGVEFNFAGDPTSNFIVFNSTRREPSLLFSWEPTEKTNISQQWRLETLGTLNSKVINFLNKAESKILTDIHSTWTPADIMTVAAMIWPDLIKKSIITNIIPIYSGEASGALLVDYYGRIKEEKNVEIVQEIDSEKFKNILLEYFS